MFQLMSLESKTDTLALTANTSNRVELAGTGDYISIYNPADTVTYVKIGGSTVTAAATDVAVPPGMLLSWRKDKTAKYLAGFNATEGVTLNIQCGDGA